jgi:hypothetical protein
VKQNIENNTLLARIPIFYYKLPNNGGVIAMKYRKIGAFGATLLSISHPALAAQNHEPQAIVASLKIIDPNPIVPMVRDCSATITLFPEVGPNSKSLEISSLIQIACPVKFGFAMLMTDMTVNLSDEQKVQFTKGFNNKANGVPGLFGGSVYYDVTSASHLLCDALAFRQIISFKAANDLLRQVYARDHVASKQRQACVHPKSGGDFFGRSFVR